jgi:ElaB/YqjD/DUF883 family membrane-anchored ribosome-binding protein
MNISEHNFPLPDLESHKLDQLREEISPKARFETAAGFFRESPWAAITLAGVAGFLAWFLIRRT